MCSGRRERPASPESSTSVDVKLPDSFVPSNRDVVCGRSKRNYYYDGNKYFREVVASYVLKYISAKTKVDKGCVILSIVDVIREASPQGGFVRQDPATKAWYLVGENAAREKLGATLRSIIKASGGEETLLSQTDHAENKLQTSSEGDPLIDWIPPSIATASLVQQDDEGEISPLASNSLFGFESGKLETDASLWKSTGPELEPEELNWLLGVTEDDGPQLPQVATGKSSNDPNDTVASRKIGKSILDDFDDADFY